MYAALYMARRIPPGRLEHLVECATQVFIKQGYRRTQMSDVATAAGIAKGTLYLYVESKEALFDLVLRCADALQPVDNLTPLPIPTPPPGATVKYVQERLAQNQVLPALISALTLDHVADPRAELEGIIGELYGILARNRRAIELVDRSAPDHPELAALWFEGARGGLMDGLTRYLDARIRHQLLRPVPDTAVAARLIIETMVFWAVHRHWDPHPQTVDDAVAQDTVVRFIVGALT